MIYGTWQRLLISVGLQCGCSEPEYEGCSEEYNMKEAGEEEIGDQCKVVVKADGGTLV